MLKNKRIVLFSILVLLLGIIIASIILINPSQKEKVKIGFVMSGSIDEEGWNGIHYSGIKDACDELDVELIVKQNIEEFSGKCEPAANELIKSGCKMIVLSSYGYTEEVMDLIKDNKDVTFYVNSFNVQLDNVVSYFSRMYQARYLSGIIAGMKTKSNKIGYVAAMDNSEVNRGMSAFTLGVKRVNKDAKVLVTWTGAWDDEKAERQNAKDLIEQGVDVLTYHQNKSYVSEEAEAAGVYSIGYHQQPQNYSSKYLTTVSSDWKLTYKAIVRQYLKGNPDNLKIYWIGMNEDAVKISECSSDVSEDIKIQIDKARNEILAGRDVFSGLIYDNKGIVRCKENETIKDEVLLEKFDWYVEGIEFYEK